MTEMETVAARKEKGTSRHVANLQRQPRASVKEFLHEQVNTEDRPWSKTSFLFKSHVVAGGFSKSL